jgi:hypothetical protein
MARALGLGVPHEAGKKEHEKKTMNTTILNGFCLSALVLLAGCGAGADVVAAGGGPASKGGGETTAVSPLSDTSGLSIAGYVHGADGAALAGVDVCLQAGPTVAMDIGQCGTSAADGSWTLDGIPRDESVTIAFKKAGYAPSMRAIQTNTSDIVLPSDENRLSLLTDSGAARFDDHTGGIQFAVLSDEPGTVQATATLITGERQDPTPVYLDASGNAKSGATAGSAGAYANVAPGQYLLTFTGVPASCTAASGLYGFPVQSFQGADAASVVVPVVAGRITTTIGLDCRTKAGL